MEARVTRKKLSDYRPAAVNPNRGTPRGVQAIADSLGRLGAGRSLLVDRDGEAIAGSHTLEAAADAGFTDVIEVETDGHELVVVRRRDLDLDTDDRARALQIADNRTTQIGYRPDVKVLSELMERFRGDVDLRAATGYTPQEIKNLNRYAAGVRGDSMARNGAELAAQYGVTVGQVWGVGEHRLYCGDALRWPHGPADGILTDPPYEMPAGQVIQIFTPIADRAMVMTGKRQYHALCQLWTPKLEMVWVFSTPRFPPAYHHAPLIYHQRIVHLTKASTFRSVVGLAKRSTQSIGWYRPRPGFRDVLFVRRGNSSYGKPVEVFAEMLRGFSWGAVADPFMGSGSSGLAVAQMGGKFLGSELDPRVFAIALQRLAECCETEPLLLSGAALS